MSARLSVGKAGKRLGAAAFLFFLAKGLVWVVIALGGYASLAN